MPKNNNNQGDTMKLTKEEALKKIDELKKYVDEQDGETKTVGLQIKSRWDGAEVVYQSSKTTIKDAVMEAVNSGADLSYANLSGAYLRSANLSYADLSYANLSGAYLRSANLSGADLSYADLSGAYLHNAELHNAKFYGKGGTQKLTKAQLPDFLAALGFVVED